MRTRIDIALALTVITLATPGPAAAEPVTALAAAGNGPWIVLALIGMVRAALCLGNRSPLDEDDRAF